MQLSQAIFFALLLFLAYRTEANSVIPDIVKSGQISSRRPNQINRKTISIQYYDSTSKNQKVEIEIEDYTDKWQKVYIKNGNVFTTNCFQSVPKVVRISTLNKKKEKKTEDYVLTCGQRYGVIWNPQKIIWEIYNLKPKENK